MNPIAFGSRARQLFGLFTPARGTRRNEAFVICPPLGREYERAHRSLRVLGDRLTAQGYDVMRFDYYGSGDSLGDGVDVTLRGSIDDALAAVDEVCAMASVDRVTLLGVRFGALVASSAAGRDARIRRLILWDALDPGAAADHLRRAPATEPTGDRWHDGYPVPGDLLQELGDFEECAFDVTETMPTMVVYGEASPPPTLVRRRDEASWPGTWVDLPDVPSWNRAHDLGSGLVPTEVFDRIEAWCG